MEIIIGIKQIAKTVGTGTNTLYRWIKYEGFPAKKKDGVWRAVLSDIIQWIREQ
jgi:Prophage CP4-57 regulatory protein (AlpA).